MKATVSVAPSVTPGTLEEKGSPQATLTAEQVCQEHAARIYKVALRMLGQDADAEDITQEVFLQIVRKLDTFRSESAISTWLHRVTVNAALAHRRKCARRSERQLPEEMESRLDHHRLMSLWSTASQPAQHVLDVETHALIEKALAAMTPVCRDVYVLAQVDELSYPEIAAQLHLSVQAVKSRLHRARCFLRAALGPHFDRVYHG
jgi:RNA polymerase sigma-70 factor (ECF subfamily)